MSLNPQLYPPVAPVAGAAARPFWTVIVPAYKPDYLPQTLRSLMDQDPGAGQMEILILDDCSPRELEPIVRQICGSRATYIRQPQNLGTYANENFGIGLSRGIWIHLLNDDDWILPGFYEVFRQSLQNQPPKIGVACCWQSNVDPAGKEVARQPLLRESPGIVDNFLSRLGISNPTHPVGTVIRRSTFEHLGGFYDKLTYCADWDFNKRAAVFYDWWFEPQLLACYRHHASSVSREGRSNGGQLRDLQRSIEISESYLPADVKAQITAQSREGCGALSLRMASHALQQGDVQSAIQLINIGLDVVRSSHMLEQLSLLLSQPHAAKLRQQLPDFFQFISSQSGSARR